jgi:lipoyl(octanoyl) transferase
VLVFDLGRIAFDRARSLQMQAVSAVTAGGEPALFVLEHDPVVTLGRNAGLNHLLISEEELSRRDIALRRTTRGGDITCHYPGQLVAYPIFPLDRRPGGLKRFFYDLESVVLQVLSQCGMTGERIDGRPGVFVGGRKIASIGIGVKHWVSYHGLAINVGLDLGLFSLLTPCGLTGVAPTSIHCELGKDEPKFAEVKRMCVHAFQEVFATPALA